MSNGSRPTSTPIPWLSALLLLAFVAFSVHARLRHEQVAGEGAAALNAARDYFVAHPYLDPGPALTARFDAAFVQRARADHQQREAALGAIPTPEGVIRRQQAELDEHVAAALASVGELPAQQVAFAPGRSAPHTWLAYALLHVGNAVLIGNSLLLLFFGLYLVVAILRLQMRPVPFMVSFTMDFVTLYLLEALYLQRLFADGLRESR